MENVRILGIDPSLRKTGLAVVNYNVEAELNDPKRFQVTDCNVLVNPQKYKGTDAIMSMIEMMRESSENEAYKNVDDILIESPGVIFNKAWSAGMMTTIAHVAGAAIVIYDMEKTHLFKPGEWNSRQKKEVTHQKTIGILGDPSTWHFAKRVKDCHMEHVLDAASMALWWIKMNYID